MSKNPQLLVDIRYFGASAPTAWLDNVESVYSFGPQVHRVGQRIARWLYTQGFLLGPGSHLYLHFTPALKAGEIVNHGPGLEHWMHYVLYGMPVPKKAPTEEEARALLEHATFAVLKSLRLDENEMLDNGQRLIAAQGAALRIPREVKETRTHVVTVSFNVPRWKDAAYLYVSVRDKGTGVTRELKPFPLRDYEDALFLVDRIVMKGDVITIHPRKSARAEFFTEKYKLPLVFTM